MALSMPGEFITAKCSRCNDVTGHVVMVVVGGEITKVECKACGSVHKYRTAKPVAGTAKASAAVRHVRAGQGRDQAKDLGLTARKAATASAKAAAASAAKIETAWQEAMVRNGANDPIPYSMDASFEPGMYVEHPVFGRGEVLSIARPDKVEILFHEGVKILRCAL